MIVYIGHLGSVVGVINARNISVSSKVRSRIHELILIAWGRALLI